MSLASIPPIRALPVPVALVRHEDRESLLTAIGIYIDGWNDRAHPFTWTKNADDIIAHAKPSTDRKKTYNTRH